MKRALLPFVILSLFCIAHLSAQSINPKSRVSQIALATYKSPEGYLKIHYGQPYRKDRAIFGALVPYHQVWRTGANEATELTTTSDLLIGNKELKAGTYSVYTIPQPNRWTIILNSDLGAWGAYEYTPKKDVLRFEVPVGHTPETYEAFTINILGDGPEAEIQMMWEQTFVSIPVKILGATASAP
ncbi:Protein of unknown function [Catalinimonas alkaloidigena]|uniref:DUF2911 domain-containing protein n=1 Tax=Catalinimonas alkaloidigena TaxID=1075417 RepID=A0A1G9DD99_9BACT|nr:DUF2911 domain-containing protein [Catalinimonas alkaloidigena]SDK61856.1 Protein of unknown function [Catalinimonas alkaloidigena]